MNAILAITVGGSCQPIVTAIHDYAPTHVAFLVSTGKRGSKKTVMGDGRPCRSYSEDDKINIVTQAGLSQEQYSIVEINEPDSLQTCYTNARNALSDLQSRFPDCEYIADYTGGTKTMSAGLVMAALEAEWKLSLVKGARTDLVRVIDGTEMAGLVNSWEVRARQRMQEARGLFNAYQYSAMVELLQPILRTTPLSTNLQAMLRQWIVYARGFDAWDRFDHQSAYQVLQTQQGELSKNFLMLKRLLGKDRKGATGYEPVFDLLRNTERRAEQGRFDDAVARLYRAMEMFAQISLQKRTSPLDSGNIDLKLLPEELHEKYQALADRRDGVIRLGLRQDYELLNDLDDFAGQHFVTNMNQILNALTARNQSILAHGTRPLTESTYHDVGKVVTDFLSEVCKKKKIRVDAPQFPVLKGDMLIDRGRS